MHDENVAPANLAGALLDGPIFSLTFEVLQMAASGKLLCSHTSFACFNMELSYLQDVFSVCLTVLKRLSDPHAASFQACFQVLEVISKVKMLS